MAAVLMSREYYKDATVLILTALLYIYVFLTDPNHKVPTIKSQDTESGKPKEKKQKNKKSKK
jgi:UDP-GlcNAc:undecaprenyl-phosphate GlcNAc-1-phosphate transferase